jgi:hypothetical protein
MTALKAGKRSGALARCGQQNLSATRTTWMADGWQSKIIQ